MGKLEKHWGKDSNVQVRRCEEDKERKEVNNNTCGLDIRVKEVKIAKLG